MENNLNADILDKITKVCTCKSISRAKIKEAIKNGADFIVLGRAITKENNKTEVIEKIYKEILNG